MDLKVAKLDGEEISLRNDLKGVLRAFEADGCIVLRQATSVPGSVLWDRDSDTHASGIGTRREIILNEAVRVVLFAARNDDFLITGSYPYEAGVENGQIGRDGSWKQMLSDEGFVGAMCVHLGGDTSVSWRVDVDKSSRNSSASEVVAVKANGGDIFMCHHWLLRSTPFLEREPPMKALTVHVSYIWTGYLKRVYQPLDGKNELAEDCVRTGDYLVWKAKNKSPSPI